MVHGYQEGQQQGSGQETQPMKDDGSMSDGTPGRKITKRMKIDQISFYTMDHDIDDADDDYGLTS